MLNEQLFKIKGNCLKNSCSISDYSTAAVQKNRPLWKEGTCTNKSTPTTLCWLRQKQKTIISQRALKYLTCIWSHQLVLLSIFIFYVCLFCSFFFLCIYLLAARLNPNAQSHCLPHNGTMTLGVFQQIVFRWLPQAVETPEQARQR